MQAYKLSKNALVFQDESSVCRFCLNFLSTRPNSTLPRKTTTTLSRKTKVSTSQISLRSFSSTVSRTAKQGSTGKKLLPDGPARTRFAPSPTGYLHLGSLRTAIFNYLLAKKTGGQFLLRIEDTDQKRLVPDAEQRLCDDLRWAGILWDEGPQVGGPYGSYKQSERTELYQEHAQELLDLHAAYRCFCSADQTAPIQPGASLIGSAVGGCQNDCESIPHDQSAERAHNGHRHVIRMRKPATPPSWTDLVYGKVSLEKSSKHKLPQNLGVDGVVLLKGDGTPTYHLANVVDDHHMKITHVIRGSEWMASTPLHMALYGAFDWAPPSFAHVGLLTDHEQAKLSKRNFDTDIGTLRQKHGILPESLTNFLALLGWRNPTRDDVMDMQDLVKTFDLKFTKGNTIVSFDKLWFLQRKHAKKIIDTAATSKSTHPPFESLVDFVVDAVKRKHTPEQYQQILGDRDLRTYVKSVLAVDNVNYDNPDDYVARNSFFFQSDLPPALSGEHDISTERVKNLVRDIFSHALQPVASSEIASSQSLDDASFDVIQNHLDNTAAAYTAAINMRSLAEAKDDSDESKAQVKKETQTIHRYLRDKLMFGLSGPPSHKTMAVLGFDECCRRCDIDPACFGNPKLHT